MQPQFASVSLASAAYERDLRADAARVRPREAGEPRRLAVRPASVCPCRDLGTGLAGIAQPGQRPSAAATVRRLPIRTAASVHVAVRRRHGPIRRLASLADGAPGIQARNGRATRQTKTERRR